MGLVAVPAGWIIPAIIAFVAPRRTKIATPH